MKGFWMILMVLLIVSVSTLAKAEVVASEDFQVFSLQDSFSVPGTWANWSSCNKKDEAAASVGITLKKHKLDSASWLFNVYEDDSSKWYASFFAQGILLEEGESAPLTPREQRSIINVSGVSKSTWLSVGPSYEWDYENQQMIEKWFSLYGSFSLSPAVITSAEFNYVEEPRYWMNPPAIGWYANYIVKGEFLADTPQGADALGAQFVQVPEPSQFCLISGCLIILSAVCFYRRKR